MITWIELLKKNPKMTQEEFREHYENIHSRMAHYVEHLIVDYQRNYPINGYGYDVENGLTKSDARPAPEYDCINKVTFKSIADLEAMQALLSDPAITAEIEMDEELFLDREATKVFICEQEVYQFTRK